MSGTPILDREIKPPALRRNWLATLIIAAVAAIFCLVLPIQPDLWWLLPMLYASVAVHEVGHLVAAKLVGMEPGGIVIGGLMILRSGDRWLTRFEWRRIISGGLAKPLPKRGHFHAAGYAWMVAGGPLATLLLLAVSVIRYWRLGGNAPAWLSTLCWVNLVLGFSSLVPYRIGQSRSDADWLLQLRKPGESRSGMALLQVMAQETEGVLPRDWDTAIFEEMMTGPNARAGEAVRQMLAFYRRVDEGEEEAAFRHLEAALAASGVCGRAVRHWCFLEAACSSGLLRGSAENARAWLTDAINLRRPESQQGAKAAIAMCEGRYADAVKHWDAALDFVARRKLDSGLARFAKERMIFCRGECQEALARATGPAETASA